MLGEAYQPIAERRRRIEGQGVPNAPDLTLEVGNSAVGMRIIVSTVEFIPIGRAVVIM
jgi:5-enolpyruvylshikimate-3-phosphate synthase